MDSTVSQLVTLVIDSLKTDLRRQLVSLDWAAPDSVIQRIVCVARVSDTAVRLVSSCVALAFSVLVRVLYL